MAWRHTVVWLETQPLDSFEPYHERLKKVAEARHWRQTQINALNKALSDLDAVEKGSTTISLNQPGGFPTTVNWVTGLTLPDGRYRIACPLAHDPRFECELSLRAEARAEQAQAAAVAERR